MSQRRKVVAASLSSILLSEPLHSEIHGKVRLDGVHIETEVPPPHQYSDQEHFVRPSVSAPTTSGSSWMGRFFFGLLLGLILSMATGPDHSSFASSNSDWLSLIRCPPSYLYPGLENSGLDRDLAPLVVAGLNGVLFGGAIVCLGVFGTKPTGLAVEDSRTKYGLQDLPLNTKLHARLRDGQFVTATIAEPPPHNGSAIPIQYRDTTTDRYIVALVNAQQVIGIARN
jgi:hypothetical protein